MAEAPDEAAPPADLIAHIAGCPRCTGRLLLFVVARGGAWPLPTDHTCAPTEEQLPMYVDYERAHGSVAAAQAFPAIWWPTILCASCGEAYSALREVASAPNDPWQPTGPGSRQRTQLRVRGSLVRRLVGAERRLGVAWGEPHSELMIGEEEQDEYRIQIYLRRKQADRLTLVVRTHPPARGIASLMVEPHTFYLQLEPDGTAVFSDLAETIFSASSDVVVTLDTLF